MKAFVWLILVLMALAVVAAVAAAVARAFFWVTSLVEPYRVFRLGDPLSSSAAGWEVLQPWAAWPVLVGYSIPLLLLAVAGGCLVAKIRTAGEYRTVARRRAAADDQVREARRLVEETAQSRKRDQALVAKVKQINLQLARQADNEKNQRVQAVGELKRRRDREGSLQTQLAEAQEKIERLEKMLSKRDKTS